MKRGEWMHLDSLLRGQARRDQLAAAGEAEHEMLLDEAERDVQIGVHEALVDIDRRAAGGRAERLMLGEGAGIVVHYAVASGESPARGWFESPRRLRRDAGRWQSGW